jgi:hypothetical protein
MDDLRLGTGWLGGIGSPSWNRAGRYGKVQPKSEISQQTDLTTSFNYVRGATSCAWLLFEFLLGPRLAR